MKYLIQSVLLLCFLLAFSNLGYSQNAVQDSTGMPGDNFSLQGALELFKKSNTTEEFEKLINSEDNKVNNVDLNGDNEVDYVRIIEKSEDDARVYILQVAVSESENQDIAVIELEKTGAENAVIQIVGDEDIFGEEKILEPGEEDEGTPMERSDRRNGPSPSALQFKSAIIVVNVWAWPSVRFAYRPNYAPYISPWRWRKYPNYWSPWRPLTWRVYQPYTHRYHAGFRRAPVHRVVVAHNVYRPHRNTSIMVKTRNTKALNNYKVNRKKTTVIGPRCNSVTKKTTTVKGRNGNVKAQKTTVKRGRK